MNKKKQAHHLLNMRLQELARIVETMDIKDEYDVGRYNGIETALAILEDRPASTKLVSDYKVSFWDKLKSKVV